MTKVLSKAFNGSYYILADEERKLNLARRILLKFSGLYVITLESKIQKVRGHGASC